MATTKPITQDITTGAAFLQNSTSTFPQTIYNMFMNLSNNLAGENPSDAAFEMQAQAIIVACLGDDAANFIKSKWKEYYEPMSQLDYLKAPGSIQTKNMIRNGVWLRVAGEAVQIYNKKYAGDGFVCKTAVTWTPPDIQVECKGPEHPGLEGFFRVKYWNPQPFNLAYELAKRVTDDKNRDATVLFVGDKGLGKSSAALGLAEGVAQEIQKIQTKRRLLDIFNWERDLAVIDPTKTLNALNAERPISSVVLLDDMSISMDSRKFMSKQSIESSEVWITMRTLRQVVIGTTVSGSLIDKRARENFTYIIKMKDDKRYDNMFESGRGVRIGDLRGVYKNPFLDDLKFPRVKTYEHSNHIVFSSILCFPPTAPLLTYYDVFRQHEAERLRRKHEDTNEVEKVKEDDKPKCKYCGSTSLRYNQDGSITCRGTCGRKQ